MAPPVCLKKRATVRPPAPAIVPPDWSSEASVTPCVLFSPPACICRPAALPSRVRIETGPATTAPLATLLLKVTVTPDGSTTSRTLAASGIAPPAQFDGSNQFTPSPWPVQATFARGVILAVTVPLSADAKLKFAPSVRYPDQATVLPTPAFLLSNSACNVAMPGIACETVVPFAVAASPKATVTSPPMLADRAPS